MEFCDPRNPRAHTNDCSACRKHIFSLLTHPFGDSQANRLNRCGKAEGSGAVLISWEAFHYRALIKLKVFSSFGSPETDVLGFEDWELKVNCYVGSQLQLHQIHQCVNNPPAERGAPRFVPGPLDGPGVQAARLGPLVPEHHHAARQPGDPLPHQLSVQLHVQLRLSQLQSVQHGGEKGQRDHLQGPAHSAEQGGTHRCVCVYF